MAESKNVLHLSLYYPEADKHGAGGHAQDIMRKLGITYFHATPQSLGDCWWFWCCENVPDELPPYLSKLDIDPMEYVGWGLRKEDASAIDARMKEMSGEH